VREKQSYLVYENNLLGIIFVLERDDIMGEWGEAS